MTQKVHVRIESHFWLPFRAPGEVQIELFINSPQATASKPFSVNPAANSSKRAIGQERDATNHPAQTRSMENWLASSFSSVR